MADYPLLFDAPRVSDLSSGATALAKYLGDLPADYRQAQLDQAKVQLDQAKVDTVNQLKNLRLVDDQGNIDPKAYGALAQIMASTDPRGAAEVAVLGSQQQGATAAQRDAAAFAGTAGGGGSGGAAAGAGADPRGMVPYIRETAAKYGINPDVAVRVAGSEGLSSFSSGIRGEDSWGAFQLNTQGGMGNEFQRDTGLDPRDPKNEKATIDYALRRAAQEGWGPFHGAANTGIGRWAGINRATGKPQGDTVGDMVDSVWKGESVLGKVVARNISASLNVSPDTPLSATKKELAQRYVENYARRKAGDDDTTAARTADAVPRPRPRPEAAERAPPSAGAGTRGGPLTAGDRTLTEDALLASRPAAAVRQPATAPARPGELGFTLPFEAAPMIAGPPAGARPGAPAPAAAAPAVVPPPGADRVAGGFAALEPPPAAVARPPVAPPVPPPVPPPDAPAAAAAAPEGQPQKVPQLIRPRPLSPGYTDWRPAVDDMRRDGNRLMANRNAQARSMGRELLNEADAIEKTHEPTEIMPGRLIYDPEKQTLSSTTTLAAGGAGYHGAVLDADAQRYRQTGTLPPNLGRGIQGEEQARAIRQRAVEQEQEGGGNPADWPNRWRDYKVETTSLRSLRQREVGLRLAENEAKRLIPRVEQISDRINRTQYPSINSLILASQRGTGGEDVIRFGETVAALIPVYARVLKPVGVITEGDTQRANNILNTAWSQGQIHAALDQMQIELDSAKSGLEDTLSELGVSRQQLQAPDASQPQRQGQRQRGGIIRYDAQGKRIGQ